jgi:predicted Zn-dependent protease
MKKLFVLLTLMAVLGCARNPVTGRRQFVLVSESQEIAMGAQAHVQVQREFGVLDEPAIQNYVQQVGKKLAVVSHRPNLEWHFTAVDSPVINAFALPGGFIYFTRGILVYFNSEAEFAGVMGHEIGHVTARHSVNQMTRSQFAQIGLGAASVLSPTVGQFGGAAGTGLNLWFLKFSRDDEREADRLGVEYAARGGYDPREVSNFFEVLQRMSQTGDRETIPGWLSTHPDPGERVQATRTAAQEWITKLGLTPDRMTINHDAHLRNIDGLVFGDNPRAGIVEEGRFYHPEFQFQLAFPPGWRVENTRSAVHALEPNQAAQMQFTLAEAPQGTTADAYVRQLAAQGMSPVSGGPTTINGNRAYLALYSLRQDNGSNLSVLAAFIEFRKQLYQIIGAMSNPARQRSTVETAMRSFDRLTNERILAMQPDRLRIYTAREGDTLESLAKRYANPRVGVDTLAVLNRLPADEPLAAGRLVKVVEKGY